MTKTTTNHVKITTKRHGERTMVFVDGVAFGWVERAIVVIHGRVWRWGVINKRMARAGVLSAVRSGLSATKKEAMASVRREIEQKI